MKNITKAIDSGGKLEIVHGGERGGYRAYLRFNERSKFFMSPRSLTILDAMMILENCPLLHLELRDIETENTQPQIIELFKKAR